MLGAKLLSYKKKDESIPFWGNRQSKMKSPTDTESWVSVMTQPVFGESPPFIKTLHKIELTVNN